MKKIFLLISVLTLSLVTFATKPTITVDGNKSDWAEIPMLSEPGVWPMLKVLPAADAEMGTNALVYMMENTEDFDPTWAKYPKVFIDKDYNGATHTIDSYWAFSAMGLEYSMTTGATISSSWVDFPKAMSADNKVFEIGFPATYVTDLESKFGFAMYYNSGAWFCPDRSDAVKDAIDPANGFLYKTRSFTTVAGTTTLTTANVYAHQSMGEVVEYIDYGPRNNGYDTIRWAAFPINLTLPAVYSVTTNVTSTNAWKFEFWVVDVATNAIVAHIDAPASSRSSSETSYTFGKLDLSAVPAGKYMLKVKNRVAFSTVKLNSIDLTYAGGATKTIPATLVPTDVILSPRAWVDKTGTVDSILFTPRGSEGYNDQEWAKWRVSVTTAGYYNFKANVCRPDGSQRYEIKVLSSDESAELATNSLTGMPTGAASISSGSVKLEEGSYVVKVRNTYNYAKSRLLNVVAEYIGGAVQDISTSTNTTLPVNEAWYSDCTRDNDKTYIQFPSSGTASAWIKWNTAASATKYYDVTVNVTATNGHGIGVYIYEEGDPEPATPTIKESHSEETGDLALELGRVNLIGGKNYIVMVKNSTSGSTAKVTGVTFAPVAASATELPGTLAFSNAVLSEKANITDGMLYFNEAGADKDPRGQWAQWSVTTDHNGLFLFTMGITSTNGQNYKITIKDDGDNVLDYYETSLNSGDKTITHYFALETGSYFVKVENTRSYSKGHLTSLVVTEPVDVMTIDEADTDNTSWSDKVVADDAVSPTYNVQIIRTLKANMYNTFCLPFRVPDDMCKDLFGSDVEIYTLKEAIVDDNILNLELNKSSDVWQGTPVFIKPSRNIVNPVFSGVVFKRLVPSATTKTNANFTGSFVATTLGPDPDILFLAQDNMLYYPQEEIPILGMRGWLVLHSVSSPKSPRRANFILPDKMPTAIEIVNGDILPLDKTMKVIENGQLIIIRDGVRYNVMGVRVK